MDVPILLVIAVTLTCGMYMVLERTLLRVVIGLGLMSNGVNLMLLASGGLGAGTAPILHGQRDYGASPVDPLPQALILTAIVIGFGVTALLLTLAYRTYQSVGSDDLGELDGKLTDE